MLARFFATGLFVCCATFAADVTFYRDVLPVLQKRCQECHRAGEAAPMAFMTYKDTRPWAAAIREAVSSRKMPPWHADGGHGKFTNDRRLAQEEIDTLSNWAKTGAKEGRRQDAPEPREFTEGWTIGKPDVVIDMAADYAVPAHGEIEYTYFVVPTGFTEDKWVEKIEVRPGARQVVHHVVLFAREPGASFHRAAKVGVPYVPPKTPPPAVRPVDTGQGVLYGLAGRGSEMVSVYVPGGVAYQTRPGQARLIKAGSDLIFQMHYTANGKEAVDRTKVGIVYAKAPPTERVVNTFLMNGNLNIPPQADNHRVEARATVHEDVNLESFFPHMHLRGKAMEYRAVYPTGETQVLLNVPKYDFNWQLTYALKDPLRLPKGTRLEVSAWYDNSPNNKFNPDPKAQVYWGDQSWEEMLAAFMDFAIPAAMNPADIAKPKPPVQAASAP